MRLEISCSLISTDGVFEAEDIMCCFIILEKRRIGNVPERSMRATADSEPCVWISLYDFGSRRRAMM